MKVWKKAKKRSEKEVALKLLPENEPVERIARNTGLSKDTIEELRRQRSRRSHEADRAGKQASC